MYKIRQYSIFQFLEQIWGSGEFFNVLNHHYEECRFSNLARRRFLSTCGLLTDWWTQLVHGLDLPSKADCYLQTILGKLASVCTCAWSVLELRLRVFPFRPNFTFLFLVTWCHTLIKTTATAPWVSFCSQSLASETYDSLPRYRTASKYWFVSIEIWIQDNDSKTIHNVQNLT